MEAEYGTEGYYRSVLAKVVELDLPTRWILGEDGTITLTLNAEALTLMHDALEDALQHQVTLDENGEPDEDGERLRLQNRLHAIQMLLDLLLRLSKSGREAGGYELTFNSVTAYAQQAGLNVCPSKGLS